MTDRIQQRTWPIPPWGFLAWRPDDPRRSFWPHASCELAEQLAAEASMGTQMDFTLRTDLQVASHTEPKQNR